MCLLREGVNVFIREWQAVPFAPHIRVCSRRPIAAGTSRPGNDNGTRGIKTPSALPISLVSHVR
jgi:hypothetical protein